MSALKLSKINKLLQGTPSGVVISSTWLSRNGYRPELIRNYKKSGWLESFGNGAVKRYNDQVDYLGAVYTLQTQLGMSIHPGAKTALGLLGLAHYLEMNPKSAILFAKENENLPRWFKKYSWNLSIKCYTSSFLPADIGLTNFSYKNFNLRISSPSRALMECLYLSPNQTTLDECFELMQGLLHIIPSQVQELLEKCNSVKVNRLFLFLAEKFDHSWVKHINKEKIDLGKGKRSFVKGGVYIPQYQITVSKNLGNEELSEI